MRGDRTVLQMKWFTFAEIIIISAHKHRPVTVTPGKCKLDYSLLAQNKHVHVYAHEQKHNPDKIKCPENEIVTMSLADHAY